MALLPSETSDEYCFSSLYPVSLESRDYLFYCNHCWKLDQYLVYIIILSAIIAWSLNDVNPAAMFKRNRKVYLENVPYQLKPSMIVCCFISNINW